MFDQTQKIEASAPSVFFGKSQSLCTSPEETLEFYGQKFVPDDTRGYISLKLSHAMPVRNMFGQSLMHRVIAKSYKTMLHQNFNWMHRLVAYDPTKIHADKIIGTVLAVNFPSEPVTGWTIGSVDDSPGIEAVAVFTKLATGMDRIIGRHKSGRHTYSVSMECTWPYDGSGFAVAKSEKAKANSNTPDTLARAGYEYWSWNDAPDELKATYSREKGRVVKKYRDRQVTMLLGGLDGEVHYDGVGLVEQGAEVEAHIMRMAASLDAPWDRAMHSISSLGEFSRHIREKFGDKKIV